MATWKKVIVSGSAAHLANASASGVMLYSGSGEPSAFVKLAVGTTPANYTITLPDSAPGSNTALTYNGSSYVWGAVTSVAGTGSAVQFNLGGSATGSSKFTFNEGTSTLRIIGDVSASSFSGSFSGSGANLFGVPTSSITNFDTNVSRSAAIYGFGVAGTGSAIQFNLGGAMTGSSKLTWNEGTNQLILTGSMTASAGLQVGGEFYVISGSQGQSPGVTITGNSRLTVNMNGTANAYPLLVQQGSTSGGGVNQAFDIRKTYTTVNLTGSHLLGTFGVTTTSGTPLDGYGLKLRYIIDNNASTEKEVAHNEVILSNATASAEFADIAFSAVSASLMDRVFTIRGNREIRIGTSASYIGLAPTTGSTNYTITFPAATPTSNQYLAYDGTNYVWTASSATVANEVIQDAAFAIIQDSSTIDLVYNDASDIFRADIISGSLQNAALANSTIRIEGTSITGDASVALGATASLEVAYGSSANTAVQGNTTITINGTANEVEITGTAAQALGGGPSYTIGLPDNVTIGGKLTVTGDLEVNGTTTTVNTANILVEDKFIQLASGSAGATDGGIIITQNTTDVGVAFFYDSGVDRFSYAKNLSATASAATPLSYVGAVETAAASPSTAPQFGSTSGYGTIHVDTGTQDIWIYS